MASNTGPVMTLANSIIGVGILAMPFCFQKCGVILSIFLLLLNNFITRQSCHYLTKSSILSRSKGFEFLAYYAFGPPGKLMVELCIIGYLMGTCIAYFVVVGDLGPQIIAKMFNLTESDKLRTWTMIVVTIVCIIPLGMLKNVDSLATVCTASIGFYLCLVVKVIAEASVHILANDWIQHIEYWKPSGMLQCLPIFSMALSCQMQLFEVFETIPNPTLEKMNEIIKSATGICTTVYVSVGLFGYIAFCSQLFSGNILIYFSPSLASDAIKIGFVLSIAFSFPLVIFPCRVSINSLLFHKGHSENSTYIPDYRFKVITLLIIFFSLSVALLIPSVELVIGLVGSTIGVAICIMFPASCYIEICKKDSLEKRLAQFLLVGGFCLMILGTYANLNAIDEKRSGHIVENSNLDNMMLEKESQLSNVITALPNNIVEQNKLQNPQRNLMDSKGSTTSKSNSKNILPKQTEKAGEINNDALRKDDEVAAEEYKVRKVDTDKADIELQKAKEMLEKKVDELQKHMEKENEKTKNLVAEKLGEIADKVNEIEMVVHESTGNEKQIHLKNHDELTISKNNVEARQNNKINENNLNVFNADIPQDSKLPKISGDPIVNILLQENPKKSNLQKDQRAVSKEENQKQFIYEPLSYKTGEILNRASKERKNNNSKPLLPLPLLLNSTVIDEHLLLNTSNKNKILLKDPLDPSPLQKEKEMNKKEEITSNHHENKIEIESIRRDILQIQSDKDEMNEKQKQPIVTMNGDEERNNFNNDILNREKRTAENICIDLNVKTDDCMRKEDSTNVIRSADDHHENFESLGRDLKDM